MDSNVISEAMERFVLDGEASNGLMIADLPTGIGKTYQACRMMLDVCTKNPGRKFIFITEQVKNLPVEMLERLSRDPSGPEFIVVPSNAEAVMGHAFDDNLQRIRQLLDSGGEDQKPLDALVKARRAYRRAQNSYDPSYREWTLLKLQESEREFRKAVKRALRREFGDKAARVAAVATDPRYMWISEVYPSARFESADIVLMTDKKFLKRIDTIVGRSYSIWAETDFRPSKGGADGAPVTGSSQLSDHTVIIDEFDVFKRVIVDTLIEENRKPIDTVRAFRFIHSRLKQWKTLPKAMMVPSRWWETRRSSTTIEKRFENLLSMADDIQSKYHLEYLMKQYGVDREGRPSDTPAVSFMFHDCQQFSVGNAIRITPEEGTRYNKIFVGKTPTMKCFSFNDLANKIDNLFEKLSLLVWDLAMNHRYNLLDGGAGPDEERSSVYMCVESVIDVFDMDEELSEYFRYKSLHRSLRFTDGVDYLTSECTHYSKGFSHICLEDGYGSQFQTKLYLTSYDVTPELILRHMCERTKVIGLSATAGIRSPVCNFSMDYLRDAGVRFHRMSPGESEGVRRVNESNAVGFVRGDARLRVEPVGVPDGYGIYSWEALFGEDEAQALFDRIRPPADSESSYEFYCNRYVRAAGAFETFVSDSSIRSMICFFPASLKSREESTFQTAHVDMILDCLERRHGISIDRWWDGADHQWREADCEFVSIDSSNADDRLRVVKSRLSEGRKVMIVTAYRTLGAGQNLQYRMPAECDSVWVREGEPEGEEKDFDAVYLDNPTSVAPMVNHGEPDSLDRYLFFVEDLDAANEIGINEKYQEVRNAFMRCYGSTDSRSPQHFKGTDSYNLALAQTVMQAVGRMTRTGWRSRDTLILYDPTVATGGMFSMDEDMYGSHLGYEFRRMYGELHAPAEAVNATAAEKAEWDAIRRTHNFYGFIEDTRKSMYNGHTASIELWKAVREFVLMHPTVDPSEWEDDPRLKRLVRYGYIEPPVPSSSYVYTKSQDFEGTSSDGLAVSFTGPRRIKGGSGRWYEVCPETANMDLLRRIVPVREALDEMGAPSEFAPMRCIMSPLLFQNVYMGALGEVAGRAILDSEGVELYELDQKKYERFDFVHGSLYFDFKNWNRTRFDDPKFTEKQKKNVASKLEDCGGRRVYVINIVFDQDREVEPYHVTDLGKGLEMCEVPYLYRFVDGRLQKNDRFFEKLEGDINGH